MLLSEQKKAEIKAHIQQGGRYGQLWEDYRRRVASYTDTPVLIKSNDNVKWWHIIWERLGDAAFVHAIEPDEKTAAFVHDVTMAVCTNQKQYDWIGPWFRKREEPPVGQLETAHVAVAVSVAYDFCPGLFSAEEREVILGALRDKALKQCERFIDCRTNGFNNWKMVLLNGFAVTACTLRDSRAVQKAVEFYNTCLQAYNKDSYGESVQYSNYATLNLVHAYEVLTSYDPALSGKLDTTVFVGLMRWYAESLMYMKPLYGEWGEKAYPRTLNFGDSAAIFRPSGDVLLYVASALKGSMPQEAGLARWLFETTYKEDLGPFDRSTFGFVNQYHYYTFMRYMDAAAPLSPKELDLPLLDTFETGTTVYRDSWENPTIILGIQGGYQPHNVTGHRHKDQNSFILAYKNERFILDPGHCCYRLYSHRYATECQSHNTWTFEKEGGQILTQAQVSGSFAYGVQAPMNVLTRREKVDDLLIIQSDCAKAYGDEIEKAERTWLLLRENQMMIVDRIKARVPVKTHSYFVMNNRTVSDERNFYGKRIVLRRNGLGMKFLPMELDGINVRMEREWTFVHDCYHPEPNNLGQGREGSGLVYHYIPEDYAAEFAAVYVIIFDTSEEIPHWHAKELGNNEFYIEPGDHVGGMRLFLDEDGLRVVDCYRDQTYFVR